MGGSSVNSDYFKSYHQAATITIHGKMRRSVKMLDVVLFLIVEASKWSKGPMIPHPDILSCISLYCSMCERR